MGTASGHYKAKRAFQWSEQKADYFENEKSSKGSGVWAPLKKIASLLQRVGCGNLVPKSMQEGEEASPFTLKRKLLNLRRGGTMINPQSNYCIQKDDMLIVMAVDHADAMCISDEGEGNLAQELAAMATAPEKPAQDATDATDAESEIESVAAKSVTGTDGHSGGIGNTVAHTRSRSGCRPILDYHDKLNTAQQKLLDDFMRQGVDYNTAIERKFSNIDAASQHDGFENPQEMKHLIVVGHWSTAVIRQIVMGGWRRRDRTHLVFMDTDLPSEKDWEELSNGVLMSDEERKTLRGLFPLVTLIKGSPLNKADLVRAGIETASAVCIVSDFGQRSAQRNSNRSLDGKTIKISLVIRQFQRELEENTNKKKSLFPVYELVDHMNVSFIDQSSYVATEVALAPVYRGGHMFVPTMLDTLLCQSFFNPQITNILEVLLPSVAQIQLGGAKASKDLPEDILSSIENENYTYGELFEVLLDKGMVLVALYSGEPFDEVCVSHRKQKLGKRVSHIYMGGVGGGRERVCAEREKRTERFLSPYPASSHPLTTLFLFFCHFFSPRRQQTR